MVLEPAPQLAGLEFVPLVLEAANLEAMCLAPVPGLAGLEFVLVVLRPELAELGLVWVEREWEPLGMVRLGWLVAGRELLPSSRELVVR